MRTRGKSEDGGRPSDSGSPNKVDDLKCLLVEQKYCPEANIPISAGDRKSRSRAGSLDCSISSDNSESKPSKKKKRGKDGVFESDEVPGDTGVQNEDFRLFESCFPKEFEPDFSTAVFELGLKHSSPKVLMSLMPLFTNLHSEHLKSHLQKYRIHHERSKDEFLAFYNEFMRDDFLAWENRKGWEINHVKMNAGNNTASDQFSFSAGDSKLSLQVPSLEITNAASCLLNSADNLTGVGMAISPFNRVNGAQPQSPTGSQKKTRSLAGYKNVVSQASQLYSEWRLLFEESQIDASKISNYTFSSSDCVNGEYDPKFNKGTGMITGKGKRLQDLGPGSGVQCQGISSRYHDDSMSWQNNNSSSSGMNNNNNINNINSDTNGSSSSSSSTNNLASISTDTIHNSHLNSISHNVGGGCGGLSSNFGGVLNGDPNMNMIYFNNNNNNPHPLLPLHLNPYGGYSNNYSPASSYSSLSHSAQQQSLSLSHPNQNMHPSSSSVTDINGINCLSNLSNNLNVLNNLANLGNLNSYLSPPADSFLTLPVNGTGVSHYLPPLPLLSNSRVSSQDGSDADSNSESSNASNVTCSTNETLSASMTINGNILNNGLGNPYLYAAHEKNRVSEVLNTSKKVLLRPHR